MTNGQLKVWWIPQLPGERFEVLVDSPEEADLVLSVLADYDKFQFENHIKPDYANAGGLVIWDEDSDGEGSPDWVDWYDPETELDFDEYREEYLK